MVYTLDSSCLSEEYSWSILTSSASNSNLAVVLSGLLIATIAVLFHQQDERHTIAMFATGVVLLALDSYLFSHITGIHAFTPDPSTAPSSEAIGQACIRAWLSGLPASGMLATGGVALACGLSWMMATYVAQGPSVDPFLAKLGATLAAVVITIVTLLLAATTAQALRQIFGIFGIDLPYLWTLLITGLAVIMFSVWRVVSSCGKISSAISHRNDKRPDFDLLPDNGSGVRRVRLRGEERMLKAATYCAAGLAFLGPLYVGLLALIEKWPTEHVNPRLVTFAILGGILGLLYPYVIFVLMSMAQPEPYRGNRTVASEIPVTVGMSERAPTKYPVRITMNFSLFSRK